MIRIDKQIPDIKTTNFIISKRLLQVINGLSEFIKENRETIERQFNFLNREIIKCIGIHLNCQKSCLKIILIKNNEIIDS